MCLNIIKTDYSKQRERNFGIGWKTFMLNGKGQLESVYQDTVFKEGVWLKDKKTNTIYADRRRDELDSMKYETGFHVWLSEADAKVHAKAKNGVCRRVLYRKVVCFGNNENVGLWAPGNTQYTNCIVAKELFIEKE
jgi:hypothetical protein